MFVTGAICSGLVLIQVLILMLMPNEGARVKKIFSLHSLFSHLFVFAFMTIFFFVLVNAYYSLVKKRSSFKKYIPVTLICLVFYTIYLCVSWWLFPEKTEATMTFGVLIVTGSITAGFMIGIGLLIAYLTSLRDEQKLHKTLEKQKMELEIENSQANFNFLKAQINPHFLHNTLNFFYAKALPLSAELSEGILCLSDIMRYALNEGGKDEKALLKDEIEHLENVIRINQFRFSNKLNVQFEVTGVTAGAMIVPFVLITLVENAFKHGDLKSPDNPIIIRIIVEDKRLYFYCRNKKNPGFKEISTGIGLQNILKRLDIMYGSNYSYKVNEDEDFYSTELIINSL